jgi:hypothetical protein
MTLYISLETGDAGLSAARADLQRNVGGFAMAGEASFHGPRGTPCDRDTHA